MRERIRIKLGFRALGDKVRERIRIRVAQDNTVMATPVCVFRVSPVMQTDGNAQVDVNTTQVPN